MKKIICYITAIILVMSLGLIPTLATDEATEPETTTEAATTLEFDSAAADEIVEILKDSGTKSEAIIALAERLGITTSDAEDLINSIVEVGDEYLGETKFWVGFKSSIEEDKQFWILIATIALVALALVWLALTIYLKVSSPMKRVDYSMNSDEGMASTVKQMKNELSRALAKLNKMYENALEQEEYYETELLAKEEEILKKDEEIVQLKAANYEERKNICSAAAYNLRMLKLLSDRTNMPMQDKATIDLFYASGINSIKAVLSEEDFAKIEQMTKILDTVRGDKNGQGQT